MSIEVKNFSKWYEGRRIVRDVSFTADPARILVVIGRSGCGKSTLLRHMACLEGRETGPLRGEVLVEGRDVARLSERQRARVGLRGSVVGLVFQNAALFDFLDVRGNLAWPLTERLRMRGDQVEARVREALSLVELGPAEDYLHRDVATLSGGQRRRVALARALVLKPRIILYDEPTTGLDPPAAGGINRLIRRLNQERGITSVVTTHDMQSARMVADRVVMMQDGAVVFDGTYDEAEGVEEVKSFILGDA